MSTASVAVPEKSVPQIIGDPFFFFTGYRSSSILELLAGSKTSSDLFMAESLCASINKQIVAISGNLKARRRLENEGAFAPTQMFCVMLHSTGKDVFLFRLLLQWTATFL